MIDIHSHILPGVDDGAKTLDEAFNMLEIAISQGVTTQILTPHIQIGRYNNTKSLLQSAFTEFEAKVKNKGLNIQLKLAAEVRIGPEIMPLVINDQIPFLGSLNNKKVFLLEFPRIDIPFGSDNLVRWLLQNNTLPLIVHPERNRTFVDHSEKLEPFIEMGCPLQITASSLTGKFGDDVQKMAIKLIEQGKVFAIASDCHNLKGRSPDLKQAAEFVGYNFGKNYVETLFHDNPSSLI